MGILAFSATPVHAEGISRLADFLASDVGLELLNGTSAGRTLASRFVGRRISTPKDLAELRFRLQARDPKTLRLRTELERRLGYLEGELRAAGGYSSKGVPAETAEEIAERYFTLKNGRDGEVEFAPFAKPRSFGSWRFDHVISESQPGRTFEAIMPVEPGSIEARLPDQEKIYDRLLNLEKKYLKDHKLGNTEQMAELLMARTGKSELTVKELIEHVLHMRGKLASELRALATSYKTDEPFLARTMKSAADKIGVSDNAWAHFQEKAPEFEGVHYRPGKHSDIVHSYASSLRGEFGELLVAVRAANVVERGITVEQMGELFGSGRLAERARSELAKLMEEFPDFADKEIDLVMMNRGLEWGEVKAYGEVFGPSHPFYKKVMLQAQKTAQIKELLESCPAVEAALEALGGPLKLKIYFMGGVTEGAAMELEALGIEVYGVRYLVWNDAPVCPFEEGWILSHERLAA